MDRTFAIIKPDAVAAKATGAILARIEKEGFRIVGMRLVHMTRPDAEGFYAVHRERPFFHDLVTFMSSGPSIVLALESPNAIAKWREVIGATDPAKAAEGTVRKQFATDIEKNAVHGSDAPATASQEIAFWFRAQELLAID